MSFQPLPFLHFVYTNLPAKDQNVVAETRAERTEDAPKEQMMHHGSENLLQTEQQRGVARYLSRQEMELLCLKSLHIMGTSKGQSVKSAKSVETCQRWEWNDLTQWLLGFFYEVFFLKKKPATPPVKAVFLQLFTLSPCLAFSDQGHLSGAAHSLL